MARKPLLIFGASTRAAAFSALRAGFSPWCSDLFADIDLQQHAPVVQLNNRYPDGFLDLINVEYPGPWLYTGGLENHPSLVHKMASRRPLWGNDQDSLLAVRSPFTITQALHQAGLPAPAIRKPDNSITIVSWQWLVKPLAGAGGAGICFLDSTVYPPPLDADKYYLQEYIEGESRAAIFLGDGRSARLLGVTRQLVGQNWLHAEPFHYCGNIGPLPLTQDETAALERLGNVLAANCGLRGLFGVDGIWRDGFLWPVEINPRYTASVEVLEYATGLRALAWHAEVFCTDALPHDHIPVSTGVVGKAILFAREAIVFPAEGAWSTVLDTSTSVKKMPPFADISPAGTAIEAGKPVLTFFTKAASVEACEAALKDIAAKLDHHLLICN